MRRTLRLLLVFGLMAACSTDRSPVETVAPTTTVRPVDTARAADVAVTTRRADTADLVARDKAIIEFAAAVAAEEAARAAAEEAAAVQAAQRAEAAETAEAEAETIPPLVIEKVEPGSIEEAICYIFGDACAAAISVADCESGMNPSATGRAGERGLFQIHPVHRDWVESMGYSWDQMYGVTPNVQVAFYMWSSGGWGPWSCKP